MADGVNVRDAAHRIGISRARVYRLIEKARLRVVEPAGQPRTDRGRYTRGGILLDFDDVEREAAIRGR